MKLGMVFVTVWGLSLPAAEAPAGSQFIKSFDKLSATIGRAGSGPRQVRLTAPGKPGPCAVPLRQMDVKDPQQFTGKRVTPGETVPMPATQVPAPPCESR